MSRARKLYTVTAKTTPEEIRNIPADYTGISVEGMASVECVLAIPRHAYEVEVLNVDAIRYLRALPRYVNRLIVSHLTHEAVLKPFAKSLTRIRIKDGSFINPGTVFHKYIQEVKYPDGHVEKFRDGQASEEDAPLPVSKTISTTKTKNVKEKTTETFEGKTIQKETEKTVVTQTEEVEHFSPKEAAANSLKRSRREESDSDEKGNDHREPETKRAKIEKPEKSEAMELSDDSDMEGLPAALPQRAVPLSKTFDLLWLGGRTTIEEIKNIKCSTVQLLREGFSIKKLKLIGNVKRIEFGADIDGSDLLEFPAIVQTKLFHGITLSSIAKLKSTVKWVVLSKYVDGAPGEEIYNDIAIITDAKLAKKQALEQTVNVVKALKAGLKPRIAVAIEESVKPFTKLKNANAGVTDVEINQYTTLKAVQRLAGLGVQSIWLGHNVQPEVVAAIPQDIRNVVVGLDVCLESVQAIAKDKSIIYADGVDMRLYDEIAEMQGVEALENAWSALKVEHSRLFDDCILEFAEEEKEEKAINVLKTHDLIEHLMEFAAQPGLPVAPPVPVAAPVFFAAPVQVAAPIIAPNAAFFQAPAPAAANPARIVLNLVSDDEDVVMTDAVNNEEESSDEVIFVKEVPSTVSKRTRSKRQ